MAENPNKLYTSRRYSIVEALVEKIKEQEDSNLAGNVHPRMLFWDEVNEYPAVHMSAGNEIRDYKGGGYKDRYLAVTVRCYVQDEDPTKALEKLLADLEFIIEENGRLAYPDPQGVTQYTHDILITSIDTDEGALAPLGVGEILLQVHY